MWDVPLPPGLKNPRIGKGVSGNVGYPTPKFGMDLGWAGAGWTGCEGCPLLGYFGEHR